jgi:hypothetical protein
MNYIAGVKVTEPVCNVGHNAKSICRRVSVDVLGQPFTIYPLGNGLKGSDCYPYKRDDVWVHQTFPHYSLPTEVLRVSSDAGGKRGILVTHTFDIPRPLNGIYA